MHSISFISNEKLIFCVCLNLLNYIAWNNLRNWATQAICTVGFVLSCRICLCCFQPHTKHTQDRYAGAFTFHTHKTYTRSLRSWIHTAWPSSAFFACLFFSIKMNYRIAFGSRNKERLLWCYPEALSQWLGEGNRVLWIFWSLCLTPLRFLMDHTICNFSQTYESLLVCL